MPITLHPISRRRFLAGSVVAGISVAISRYGYADGASADPHRFALLSDTHIAADRTAHERGVTMYDHLKQAIGEVAAMSPAPAAMIVNGDCAYHFGKSEDYQQFVGLIEPIRKAGWPIHLAMGNHDDRPNFWNAIPGDGDRVKSLDNRQVLVIETPAADWIMLDSLDKTNSTPGILGKAQLDWLAAELDHRKERKIIVMVHHQPDTREKVEGLIDTPQLLETLMPRKQAKALLYGHTHEWRVEKRDDLHCINLPAVAYVFKQGEPSGWTDAHVSEDSLTLELHCLDKAHPKNGDTHKLVYRA